MADSAPAQQVRPQALGTAQRDGRFPVTQWNLVKRAGEAGDREALADLCAAYWYPVYAFLRSKGAQPELARDLTQGVFLMLLQRNDLAKLDPAVGSFRAWLRKVAERYFFNELARARALKRGRDTKHLSIDTSVAEEQLKHVRVATLTPDQVFDRCWAQTVVARALGRLREECCREPDYAQVSELLDVLAGEARRPPAADDLGRARQRSPGAERTQRCRMKAALVQRFGKLLRAEISPTVAGGASVGEEIRELLAALS
jgi:DNA-directed RNA polymerase specialized sigma24 family protein